MSAVFVLGRDEVGIVAEDRDCCGQDHKPMRYYLTECCLASAKGMESYIGCRKCYAEIDPALGDVPDKRALTNWATDPPTFGGFEDVPLRLIEVFGDGLPYDEFKARRAS